MKKTITAVCVTLVVIACGTAVYRFCLRKSIPDAPASQQVASILKQNDCFVCHSFNPQKPFYASFPVIGPQMDLHMEHAVRFVELEEASSCLDGADQVLLAKLEHALLADNMPIVEYRMIHWGTGFNKKEKAVLADWIYSSRAALVSDPAFANGPVEPVPAAVAVDEAKVQLGKKMYFDTRISLDNTISCATCHILEKGGADEPDDRTSEGIDGQFGGVNAPTVYNAYYNVQQFWNGRAADLQEQAAGPPANPVEMGDQSWDQIVERLGRDKSLVAEFKALYPDQGLTQSSVTDAIAEFEKTLTTPDSRFDLYLKGDDSALDDQEKAGYKAFLDNSCAVCHVGKTMGGQSFEYLGIFGDYFADRDASIQRNADDDGLKGFTGNEADLERFKVPNMRNVALTAPYFHDGSFADLDSAVKAMFKYELGVKPSQKDVDSIVAFLGSLNGKNQYLEN